MSNPISASDLNPEAFEKAYSQFKKNEAANWIEAQLRSDLLALKAVCKVFYLWFNEEKGTVDFQTVRFIADYKEILENAVPESEFYEEILLNRSEAFFPITNEVIDEFFPDCNECDVLTYTTLALAYIYENTDTLSKQSFNEVGNILASHFNQVKSEIIEKTNTSKWFVDLSNDWDITYLEDGSVAEDPDCD